MADVLRCSHCGHEAAVGDWYMRHMDIPTCPNCGRAKLDGRDEGQEQSQKQNVADWYDSIEPGVRDVVRLLRNNGINTTSSCHHHMTIEAGIYDDRAIFRVDRLLFNAGWRSYRITASLERVHGIPFGEGRLLIELRHPLAEEAEKDA